MGPKHMKLGATSTRKRRRKMTSDWLDTLEDSRAARRLRNDNEYSNRQLRNEQEPRSQPQARQSRRDEAVTYPRVNPLERNEGRAANRSSSEQLGSTGEGEQDHDTQPRQKIQPEDANVPVLEHIPEAEEVEPLGDPIEFQPFNIEEVEGTAPHPLEDSVEERLGPVPTVQRDARSTPEDADIGLLHSFREKWEDVLSLLGIVSIVGSVRFTVKQYEFMRDILLEKTDIEMPPYSRAQRYFREIIDACFPHSKIVKLRKKFISPLRQETECNSDNDISCSEDEGFSSPGFIPNESRNAQLSEEVRIFLPSSWAKLDVGTSVVFDKMFPMLAPNSDSRHAPPLDETAIIRNRQSVTNSCDYFYARHQSQEVICRPGYEVKVTVRDCIPPAFSSHELLSTENGYELNGKVAATWCIGSQHARSPSAERALLLSSLTSWEKGIIEYFSTAQPRPTQHSDTSDVVLPGDICTLLSTELREDEPVVLIIHRFWKYEDGIPSVQLLWLDLSINEANERGSHVLAKHVVSSIALQTSPNMHERQTEYSEKSHGVLEDGTPYVVYKMLLYCDDFQKNSQLSPSGSAGGCYFLPLSLPVEARRSTSAVRIISLTPHGVSTNEVLHYIVDDLVKATVDGIRGYTPYGEEVIIFIDVVAFVGDYPAASGTIDTIGHVGRSPCTLCSFRRLHKREAEGSRFGFTTNVHSNNTSFLRQTERMTSLRESNISDADANRLGMVECDKFSDRYCPLVYLQKTLEANRGGIARNKEGKPVVPGMFDAYRSNLIAPDHLLTGLSKNVLNAMYMALPTEQMRVWADIYICIALKDNGLLQQKEVFNHEKKRLQNMSLSELYCVLLVSVPVLKVVTSTLPASETVINVVQLLEGLQQLVSFTYWWPEIELDGIRAQNIVRYDKEKYFSDLKEMSKNYVKAVDNICSRSTLVRKQLDKPNLHRLIELYEHSIPALGHAREFMELVFESAHQPLKRCIARSNNHKPHISAVEHCVGNDWQGRLSALYSELRNGDDERKLAATIGIRRLLLGEESYLLDNDLHKEFITDTDNILHNLFGSALQKQFQKDERVSNFCIEKASVWRGKGLGTKKWLQSQLNIGAATLSRVLERCREWIDALFPPKQEEGKDIPELLLYKTAKRVRLTTDDRVISRPNGFDVLSVGSAVQVYVDRNSRDNKVIKHSSRRDAGVCFFAINTVLQRKGDPAWAVCVRCVTDRDKLVINQKLNESSFQVLQLSPAVRRIALYHVCQEEGGRPNSCVLSPQDRTITHSAALLDGGKMYFQRRVNGYPPRMA